MHVYSNSSYLSTLPTVNNLTNLSWFITPRHSLLWNISGPTTTAEAIDRLAHRVYDISALPAISLGPQI